jgi:purine-binding chemotaxis protein CheW
LTADNTIVLTCGEIAQNISQKFNQERFYERILNGNVTFERIARAMDVQCARRILVTITYQIHLFLWRIRQTPVTFTLTDNTAIVDSEWFRAYGYLAAFFPDPNPYRASCAMRPWLKTKPERSEMQIMPTGAASSTTAVSATGTTEVMEFLAFRLGEEEYGIKILKVQEIRGYDAVTRIANVPDFIKGVVNLRGAIVPIVDMRIKFNLGAPTYDQFTVVIILTIGTRVVGMVVDSVSDVITLGADQIKPAPEMGTALTTDYLTGLGTVDERMLILIDIDRLMSSSDIGLFDQLAA